MAKKPKINPTYFHSDLTGSGKKDGVISHAASPANIAADIKPEHDSRVSFKSRTIRNGSTKIRYIPLLPILPNIYRLDASFRVAMPPRENVMRIGSNNGVEVIVDVVPALLILKKGSPDVAANRSFSVRYRIDVFKVRDDSMIAMYGHDTDAANTVTSRFSNNPRATITKIITHHADLDTSGQDDLDAWLDTYSLFDRITAAAHLWNDDEAIGTIIADLITDLTDADVSMTELTEILGYQMSYLEGFKDKVNLDEYAMMYRALSENFPTHVVQHVTKLNLNLLMSTTLDELKHIKNEIEIPHVAHPMPELPDFISPQQQAALSTTAPFMMIQAGAGTGKTTTLKWLLNVLIARKVNPTDINVLSFTNNAANQMRNSVPGVEAMTISRMMLDIYEFNYPKQRLSGLETLVNCILIKFPRDSFASAFVSKLNAVIRTEPGASTDLNSFFELNFDGCMRILDEVGQTTLEIHSIVCYQKINELREPEHIHSKYLIIDEVQDNSVFDFIYALKYVAKHKQCLYIVGDSSQVLYEFRNANPRALNALEASGIFETHKLTTNYRSGQEILDLANVELAGIAANKYAQIQLHANALDPVTAKSYQDRVKVNYMQMSAPSRDLKAAIPGLMRKRIKPFIDEALARGERTCVLIYSRRDVELVMESLDEMYPDVPKASLVSDKAYSSTTFTKFIAKFWNDVCQVAPADAPFVVQQSILNNLFVLENDSNAAKPRVTKMLTEWYSQNSTTITGWSSLVAMNMLSREQFFDNLQNNLVRFEISRNAAVQSMVSDRNAAMKESGAIEKAQLLVSTIHSAKGLEFPNTVVFYQSDETISEVKKREYYVALTRARGHEFVMAYGKEPNPAILDTHKALIKRFIEEDAAREAEQSRVQALLSN